MKIAGYDPSREGSSFIYDTKLGQKPVQFAEQFLTHVKGDLAGQPFKLEQWQSSIISNLYGWLDDAGLRRYRHCLIEVGRKSGKTTLAALIGLYMLLCDGEQGAEIYLAATTREQASYLFEIIAGMVRNNPQLNRRVKILDSRKRIIFPKTNSVLVAIAAEAGAQHGTSASCVIYDELHAAPSRELYDVLATSQGARKQPLFIVISTAGYDRHSIMYELHDYGSKVRDGAIKDAHFLPAIYSAPDDADWQNPATWRLALPNLGISVEESYIARECEKAKELPAYQNTFRQLYLSQWTESKSAWISMATWNQCAGPQPDLTGQVCYGGLDLSSTRDTSALVLAFPLDGKVYLKSYFWVPQDNARERELRDKVPYRVWQKNPEANLTMTPGKVIDYDFIQAKILELCQTYQVRQIAYDRFNATQIVGNLQNEGVEMVAWGQGYVSMNAPAKEFETMLIERKLIHGGNPVLNWQASNVSITTDPAGNIKPVKPDHRDSKKIDGIVAAVMALGLVQANPSDSLTYDSPVLIW